MDTKQRKVATATKNAFNGLTSAQINKLGQSITDPTGARAKQNYAPATQNAYQGLTMEQLAKLGQSIRHPVVQNNKVGLSADAIARSSPVKEDGSLKYGSGSNSSNNSSSLPLYPTYNNEYRYKAPTIKGTNYAGAYANGYTPSSTVLAAQQKLNAAMSNKPGAYQSQYTDQLNSLLQQVINPEKFSYDYKNDPIFQQYAKEYTKNAKLGMENAMGEAAALSGGYGNSYAQTVGQQQYNATMQELNNIIPELEQNEYNKYLQGLQNNMNAYNAVSQAEASDYAKYMDSLSQYYNDVNLARDAYNDAFSHEYSVWNDNRTNALALDEYNYNKELGQYGLDKDVYDSMYAAANTKYNNEVAKYNAEAENMLAALQNETTAAKNKSDADLKEKQAYYDFINEQNKQTNDAYDKKVTEYNKALDSLNKNPDNTYAKALVKYLGEQLGLTDNGDASGLYVNYNRQFDKARVVQDIMGLSNNYQVAEYLKKIQEKGISDEDLEDLIETIYGEGSFARTVDRLGLV